MSRSSVSLRAATPQDASWLAELWSDLLRRGDRAEQQADVELIIETQGPRSSVMVAELDGAPAGAVHLQRTTITPLDLEPVVHATSLSVFPDSRRRGVGRALMEAAVAFAESHGVHRVATSSVSGSRDSNRFLARLALGPHSMLRVGTTLGIRNRLAAAARPAARQPAGARPIGQVLAVRRSLRRSQSSPVT